MSQTSQWKETILPLGIAVLGLSLAIDGYLGLKENPEGGSVIVYLSEIGLPALVFVMALWHGIALWQSNGESV